MFNNEEMADKPLGLCENRDVDTENLPIHALISLINDLIIITGYV